MIDDSSSVTGNPAGRGFSRIFPGERQYARPPFDHMMNDEDCYGSLNFHL